MDAPTLQLLVGSGAIMVAAAVWICGISFWFERRLGDRIDRLDVRMDRHHREILALWDRPAAGGSI